MSDNQTNPAEYPYDEWIKKIHEASGYKDINPVEKHKGEKYTESEPVRSTTKSVLLTAFLVFVIAVIPRLIFIFFISDPDNPGAGWFGDAYHHWQIAYLTKEIGLTHGFLRLWDLKGMEYFWGLLHPLFTMLAFSITGLPTVGVERALTAIFGSISSALIVLLVNKHWNFKAAIAAGLFAALNPVGVFNDGTGMVEPLGIPFLLMGVYYWPSNALLAGLSLAVALMARGEYWIFSFALVGAMLFFAKKVHMDKKAALAIGFIMLTVLYMKYLLIYTPSPIYPFYENYMANIFGNWQLKAVLTPGDIAAKYTFLTIFISTAILSILVLWKKPKGMYVYLLGLGNWLFLGASFGIGQYIKSYASYVWYVRFMILPYIFLGIIFSIFLFYYIPHIKGIRFLDKIQFTWLIFFAVLIISQLVWIPIWQKYSSTTPTWAKAEYFAREIASHYHGGGLLLFDGNPEITYALVRNHNILGRNITGEMFDPYFYFNDDPYLQWKKNRKIVLKWIRDNNIRTIATYIQYDRYTKLTQNEPQFFYQDYIVPNSNLIIYQVKDDLYNEKI
jgi:hypothetical protein